MKKILIPSLLALFAVGLSQQEAKAGFSIDISIGDNHRHHRPPVIVHRPPVVVHRPPVIVHRPPVVVVPARGCDYGHGHAYVKSCDSHHGRGHGHYDYRRHDHRSPRYDAHFRRR